MGLALKQTELFEPDLYLRNTRGNAYFALLNSTPGSGYKRQRSYPVDVMAQVIQSVHANPDGRDWWVSQAEFFAPTRRLVHLSRISLLYADLDTYNLNLSGSPETLAKRLLRHCQQQDIPAPSLIVFSGRGLQCKWLLTTPLPQSALPRWNAVQQVLNSLLMDFGADSNALDASRVLRLVQTVNTKSGERVRVVHDDASARYDFDLLAKKLLPFDRDVGEKFDHLDIAIDAFGRVYLDLEKSQKPAPETIVWRDHRGEKNTIGLKQFFGFQLAWDRLADLRTLAEMRKTATGAVPDGQRDKFVFLSAVFLSQAMLDRNRIYDELKALGREFVPHWSWSQVMGASSAALDRLKDHIAGKTVCFNGSTVSPRYRFRNDTLVSELWLGIEPSEERKLKTILSATESKRRDTERAQAKRLAAGGVSRAQYLESNEQRRASGRLMRAAGHSWADVAAALGYRT
ncbi:MAG: hypothetical protein KIG95_12855, partial [Comamonas sp.]|nr:hypothetical protein [Comamonas sp.]